MGRGEGEDCSPARNKGHVLNLYHEMKNENVVSVPLLSQDDEDGEGVSSGLSLLAHSLAALAAQLGRRPECFSVGPVSQQLGA